MSAVEQACQGPPPMLWWGLGVLMIAFGIVIVVETFLSFLDRWWHR